MRRVIYNQKGGVGKSTITCNLAAVEAAMGKRTLVVDMDPQCNSTHYLLGDEASSVDKTLAEFFDQVLVYSFSRQDITEFIHATPFENLFILPSHPRLDELRDKLEARYKMFKLREELEKIPQYGAIYIDTPPSYNFFTRAALIAADRCLIPFDCDDFSRRALYSMLDNVAEITADHNRELKVGGIVVNQFQSRANLPQQIVDELISENMPILTPYISASVKIRESHMKSKPMIYLSPGHKLTGEFKALHKSVTKKR